MKKIPKYFENFAFRAFNFWDRATPAEYWVVMPALWFLIILAFVWDVQEFWDFLLRREIPPLNPLYYESIVLFGLTIIPRLSLTVRRLHDSGKSGRWAILPISALFSGLMLIFGLSATLMTSSIAGGEASSLAGVGIGIALAAAVTGSMETLWPAAFATAEALQAIGWNAIWQAVSEMLARAESAATLPTASQIGQGLQNDPIGSSSLLIAMLGTVATPFVAIFMHFFFMLLPSDRDDNQFGQSSVAPITGAPKGKPSRDVMQGYACLFEKSPEEEARIRAAQKAELKELYRSRVLGQSPVK